MKTQSSIQKVVMTGMLAAVMAVMSQIQFPLPSGVPVTMQTFAMALAGYILGWRYGLASTVVYILLGAVGVPVFAGFSGGLGFTVSRSGLLSYPWSDPAEHCNRTECMGCIPDRLRTISGKGSGISGSSLCSSKSSTQGTDQCRSTDGLSG